MRQTSIKNKNLTNYRLEKIKQLIMIKIKNMWFLHSIFEKNH